MKLASIAVLMALAVGCAANHASNGEPSKEGSETSATLRAKVDQVNAGLRARHAEAVAPELEDLIASAGFDQLPTGTRYEMLSTAGVIQYRLHHYERARAHFRGAMRLPEAAPTDAKGLLY